ncbi:MAG TPA: queuosine salvage family protein [Solirubrobacteraceae bacterium]|nr:queuosine salvage family protein [Solirubrobacteraceae bacterium]
MQQLRSACAEVAQRAQHVRIDRDAIGLYAVSLPLDRPWPADPADRDAPLSGATREESAAFCLTLDAINFGSGWFPTLRKRAARTGYYTIWAGIRERFGEHGPWSARELTEIQATALARVLGQSPGHELMMLFAHSLRDLGHHVWTEYDGRFAEVVDRAAPSAVALAEQLGSWTSFADTSRYDELVIPFLKRAQIAAADLARARVAEFRDLDRLTMFADNLVPHVLRLDGILGFDRSLVERIDRGQLIEHNCREEIEIRACAVHAVELIVAARPDSCAAQVDQVLWQRGQDRRYKSQPRHRSRCTAY